VTPQTLLRSNSHPAPAVARAAALPTPRAAKNVAVLSWVNLAGIVALWGALWGVSDQTWFGTVLLYLPRSPYLLPACLLSLAAGVWNRRALCINLLAAAIVLGPIMGWHGNPLLLGRIPPRADDELCVVTCNVQGFQPDFDQVVAELEQIQPDLVAFQEALHDDPRLDAYFRNWHVVRTAEYLVASKFPLQFAGQCESPASERTLGIRVLVDAPQGKFLAYCLHFATPRQGLNRLRSLSGLARGAIKAVERESRLRGDEAGLGRMFVGEGNPELPALVMGDFNLPSDSRIFQSYWGDLIDAHAAAGWGYGYTSPCHTHRFWPEGSPWVRIDHILTDDRFQVHHCQVGANNGSDHRLITARVQLRTRVPPDSR
jgi:endonuclease/exonuclease/phosphatase family metal-dependent hydrolase